MPHINRVRINGISYNDGNNLIDDLLLNFNNDSTTYEAINGAGKSFIMLCIMQTVIPNSYLVKRQPFKEVFRGRNATKVAHVAVEWTLDESADYKYLLTGFCARKKVSAEGYDNKNIENFGDDSSSMDYFNYMIFYNNSHQYDIKNFPFFEFDKVGKSRVSYDKLKSNIKKYKQEIPYVSNINIGIFGPNESSGLNEYKRNLAQYNILDTEWEILRQVNSGENNISKFFDKYTRPDTFILKFLVPEIIEKSYMWKTNTTYQDEEKLANNLIQIKSQLKELSIKKEISHEYEYMVELIEKMLSSNEKLHTLYEDKISYEEKLCKVINFLSAQVIELTNFQDMISKECDVLEDKKKEAGRKKDAIIIKKKENAVYNKRKELDKTNDLLNSEAHIRDNLSSKINMLYARNEYISYKEELEGYESDKAKKQSIEMDSSELVNNRNYYGKIYSDYLYRQLQDNNDKLEELTKVRDEKISNQLEFEQEEKYLIDKKGRLSTEVEQLEKSINQKKQIVDDIRPNLYYSQCFDFENDYEQLSEKYKLLEVKKKNIDDEISRIPIDLVNYNNKKEIAEKSLIQFNNELKRELEQLEQYKSDKNNYLAISENFTVRFDEKLSSIIGKTYDECKQTIFTEKSEIQMLQNALENLSNQKPLSIHAELKKVFDVVHNEYMSAELGFSNIEETNEKENLLINNILVPYSIILSDRDFKSFSKNNAMKTTFGDLAIPILNREAVKEFKKLEIDEFLQFSTKPLELFIDKELINKQIIIKDRELKEHQYRLEQLYNNSEILNNRYKSALKFESTYNTDFELKAKNHIDLCNIKINEETENIENIKKSIKNTNTLLVDKNNESKEIIIEIEELINLIDILKNYIKTDNELKIEEPIFEKLSREKEELTDRIKELNNMAKSINIELYKIRSEIIGLGNIIKVTEDEHDSVVSNIDEKKMSFDEYKDVTFEIAKAEYTAANETLKNQNADLKSTIDSMMKHLNKSNAIRKTIEERYMCKIDFFDNMEKTEIIFTENDTFNQMNQQKNKIEESIQKLSSVATTIFTTIELLITGESGINELKNKYKRSYVLDYNSKFFNDIDDLSRYEYELNGEMQKIYTDIEKATKLFNEYDKKINNNKNYLDKATGIKEALEIHSNTTDKDSDVEFVKNCNDKIKVVSNKIITIKKEFEDKVIEAKERFSKANVSNFMQELNDLNPPNSLQETEVQMNMMGGEDGYIAQIQKEKENIDQKIEELLKIKENFITLCTQKCDEVYNDLKKLQDLSKIEIYGEKKEMIRLDVKNIPDDEHRRNNLSDYITQLISEFDSNNTTFSNEQSLRDKLSLSNLFKVCFNNLERWDISIYKVEGFKEHSRHLPWVRAIGSSGQTNIIYLSLIICLISYIRKLYNPSSENTKKVILCDNPFGSSGATYLYKPLMELIKSNNVQFICPGFNISASLMGLFKVNYQLGQRLAADGKINLMVESVRGEKKEVDEEFYYSGAQYDFLPDDN